MNFNDIKNVIKEIHGSKMDNREYIFWENPSSVKSIPEFLHYHVLWRNKK